MMSAYPACPRCAAAVPRASMFCPQCGTRIAALPEVKAPPSGWRICGAVLLTVGALVIGVIGLGYLGLLVLAASCSFNSSSRPQMPAEVPVIAMGLGVLGVGWVLGMIRLLR
jgi:hypothetical protein